MKIPKILDLNIEEFAQEVDTSDIFSVSETNVKELVKKITDLLKSDIKIQDFLICLVDSKRVLLAALNYHDLDSFIKFLEKNAAEDDRTKPIETTNYYDKFISKFSPKHTLIEDMDVSDAFKMFRDNEKLLTIPIVSSDLELKGKLQRNNFIDAIVDRIKD